MHWQMWLKILFEISKKPLKKPWLKLKSTLYVCLCFCREITKNKLKQIGGLTFQDLKNLKVLKLRKNSISKIDDGAFYGLDKLITL